MAEAPDIDILEFLEWREWPTLPVRMSQPQSVWLNNTLYVGGGYTSGSLRDAARLYSFKPGVDTEWLSIDTPTRRFGLVAHNSELLLLGGVDCQSNKTTNKIFKLSLKCRQFIETLPPMLESRCAPSVVSTGSVLVVAGGLGDSGWPLSSVEFLEDGQWKTAPSLPSVGAEMTSARNGDKWYLFNNAKVYSVSLSSLISGNEPSSWKTLPDAPNDDSAAAFFGRHLLSIGGDLKNPTTVINAFSTDFQYWEHVADLPIPISESSACVLPTGELVIIGGETKNVTSSGRVFRSFFEIDLTIPSTTLQPVLQLDQHGVPLIKTLSNYRFQFYATTGVSFLRKEQEKSLTLSGRDYVELVFKAWMRSKRPAYPATWEGLFTVLRKMDLAHLIQPIAKTITGTVSELETREKSRSPELIAQEGQINSDEEVDQDDETPGEAIDRLNKVNADLVNTITQLRLKIRALEEENSLPREDTKPVVKQEPFDPTVKFDPDYQSTSSALKQEQQEVEMKPVLLSQEEFFRLEARSQALDKRQLENKQLRAKLEAVEMERTLLLKSVGMSTGVREQETGTVIRESDQSASPPQSPSPAGIKGLRGVEVAGCVTVEVTNSAQSFNWSGYGFILHIPQDSLPAGLTHCTLDIIASLAGQYLLPGGHQLVSPVFWVRSHPPLLKFEKRLTVEIQHCAVITSATKLSFVRAHCSQESLPYTFTKLEGRGSFTAHSSYCSLMVNHFSGVGATAEGPVEKKYCSNVYHLGGGLDREIHFVIMKNMEAYTTMVKQHYSSQNAISQSSQPVSFESDSISLDIPDEGETVKGWTITQLMAPVILQSDVDSHKPKENTVFPHCQLGAEYPSSGGDDKVPKLNHRVNMIGAKKPYTYFVIKLDPNQKKPSQGTSSESALALNPPLVHPPSHLQVMSSAPGIPNLGTALVPVSGAGRSGNLPTMTSYYSPHHTASHYHLHLQGATPSGAGFPSTDIMRGSIPALEPPAMSIEQLVDHVGISRELLDRPVSDQHLRQIAALLPNWRQYAEALGLSRGIITAIDENKQLQYNNTWKTREVFYEWKRANPFEATFTTLVGTCLRERDNEPAKRICEMVKEEFLQSSSVVKRGHSEQEQDTEPSKRHKTSL